MARPAAKSRQRMWNYHGLMLLAFLLIGLFIRLVLASAPGNEFDVGVNQGWGKSAMYFGIAHSYEEQLDGNMLPNYAPFTVMLFTLMGNVNDLFVGEGIDTTILHRILIKMPAIAADLGAAWLLFLIVRRWKTPRHGVLAAGIAALHPASFYESAVWGQTDSVYAFFIVACLWAYFDENYFLAGIFMALSVLSKMQGVYVAPLLAVVFLHRGTLPTLKATAGGLTTLLIVFSPFIAYGNLDSVLNVYLHSVGYYSIVSSAAYNFWWAFYGDAAGTMSDTDLAIGPLNYRQVGLILFGTSYAYAIYTGWGWFSRKLKMETVIPAIFLLSAFLAHTFFMLNTEMHERYLFPFVLLGVPMVFYSRHAAIVYACISTLFLFNLLGWLPATFIDRHLYAEFASFDIIIAVLQTVLIGHFAYILWNMRAAVKRGTWKAWPRLLGLLKSI